MFLQLNGATRLFCIVGDPIEQVKSPSRLTPIIQQQGHNAVLVPIQVSANDFDTFMDTAKRIKNMDGILITIPHKFAAFKHCDQTGPRSSFLQVTNVLRREKDGLWFGDHTDGPGFLNGMREAGVDPKDERALLVGAGGAGSAIAFELLQEGAPQLAIHDVVIGRRDDLVFRLNTRFPGRAVTGSSDPKGFGVVINATPLGMNPQDEFPIQIDRLEPYAFVGDVVTEPSITNLIEAARRRGCRTQTGAGMFDGQANIVVDFLLSTVNQAN